MKNFCFIRKTNEGARKTSFVKIFSSKLKRILLRIILCLQTERVEKGYKNWNVLQSESNLDIYISKLFKEENLMERFMLMNVKVEAFCLMLTVDTNLKYEEEKNGRKKSRKDL